MNFIEDVNDKINSLKVNSFEVEVLSSGNFIELRKGTYHLNNGESIIRETVHKKVGTGNAVAVFAVDEKGKILLVIQPRVSIPNKDKINVELPAGYIENGEDAQIAGIRELEEETGYSAKEMKKIFTFYPTPGFCSEVLHIYEAKNIFKLDTPKAMDEDEVINSYFLDLEEAYKQVLDGTIKDSKTMIAIQYAYQNM